MKSFYLCFFVIILSGCLESGGLEDLAIPNVSVDCDKDQVANCSNAMGAGKTLYLGLLRNASVDCESYLAQIPSGDFAAFFQISGTDTTAFSGTATTATVTTWVNTEGFGITSISDSTHQICAFIDTDSSGTLDSNEPVADGHLNPSAPSIVDMWFNY